MKTQRTKNGDMPTSKKLLASSVSMVGWRRLPAQEYRQKMMSGWIGKLAGRSLESKKYPCIHRSDPDKPRWEDKLAIWRIGTDETSDDLNIQLTFMETIAKYGKDVLQRQAGLDFANSNYLLYHANEAGRDNIRMGIAPPDSGHPKFNQHADDLDYQIEADFVGLISPGMPAQCIELGEKFGGLMCYGDGIYGGQWISAMYAAAFFENEPVRIVEAGLKCIPVDSQYHEAISDVLQWYRTDPENWEKIQKFIQDKYSRKVRRCPVSRRQELFNVEAKINGAYVAIGMLYGNGDLEKTIEITSHCSEEYCNPGSAAGPIFTTIPFCKLPSSFVEKVDQEKIIIQNGKITLRKIFALTEKIARQMIVNAGGRIDKDGDGEDIFIIPEQIPAPSVTNQSWQAGPIANSRFTEKEMGKIKNIGNLDLKGNIHIPIGIPNTVDTLKTFVEAEGSFSPGCGSYGVYYWIFDLAENKLIAPTMKLAPCTWGLHPSGFLIPWSEWQAYDLTVLTRVCEVVRKSPEGDVFIVGSDVELKNTGQADRDVLLYVALRPLGPAGFAINEISVSDKSDALMVDGRPAIVCNEKPQTVAVSPDDNIGLLAFMGKMPNGRLARSESGDCSGAVRYHIHLPAGGKKKLGFVCPVLPGRRAVGHRWDGSTQSPQLDLNSPNPELGGLLQPDPGLAYFREINSVVLFDEAVKYWNNLLAARPLISLPDRRWSEALTAMVSHVLLLMNEDVLDAAPVMMTVWNNDVPYMTSALDNFGLFDFSELALNHYVRHPFSGGWGMYFADNPGMGLWAMGRHWLFSRDREWLKRIFPSIVKLVAIVQYLETTPGPHYVKANSLEFGDALPPDEPDEGFMERSQVLVPGTFDGVGAHLEYTQARDIGGLRAAVTMARALGKEGDAQNWKKLADSLMETYDKKFGENLAKDYGIWAVLWPSALYPFSEGKAYEQFRNFGAQVPDVWRYFDMGMAHHGLFTGNRAAGHGTIDNFLNYEKPLRGWYAMDESGLPLSAMMKAGWNPTSWAHYRTVCDYAYELPHGMAVSDLFLLIRDSLTFEEDGKLVVLGGVPESWFTAEEGITITGMYTWFGRFSLTYTLVKGGAVLNLAGPAAPPQGFILRLPLNIQAQVEADGKDLIRNPNGDIVLPTGTRDVTLKFTRTI